MKEMSALDVYLHSILTKHTKFVKKNNEYFINNVRVFISIPNDKHITFFFEGRFFKEGKKEFINALKFVCFIKKQNLYLVKPVDCPFGLTVHIYKSNWIIDKTLVDFNEKVPFVRVPKRMTIHLGVNNQTKDEYKGGFIWSKLDSSQKPKDNSFDTNSGGFSGGYNPFLFR